MDEITEFQQLTDLMLHVAGRMGIDLAREQDSVDGRIHRANRQAAAYRMRAKAAEGSAEPLNSSALSPVKPLRKVCGDTAPAHPWNGYGCQQSLPLSDFGQTEGRTLRLCRRCTGKQQGDRAAIVAALGEYLHCSPREASSALRAAQISVSHPR